MQNKKMRHFIKNKSERKFSYFALPIFLILIFGLFISINLASAQPQPSKYPSQFTINLNSKIGIYLEDYFPNWNPNTYTTYLTFYDPIKSQTVQLTDGQSYSTNAYEISLGSGSSGLNPSGKITVTSHYDSFNLDIDLLVCSGNSASDCSSFPEFIKIKTNNAQPPKQLFSPSSPTMSYNDFYSVNVNQLFDDFSSSQINVYDPEKGENVIIYAGGTETNKYFDVQYTNDHLLKIYSKKLDLASTPIKIKASNLQGSTVVNFNIAIKGTKPQLNNPPIDVYQNYLTNNQEALSTFFKSWSTMTLSFEDNFNNESVVLSTGDTDTNSAYSISLGFNYLTIQSFTSFADVNLTLTACNNAGCTPYKFNLQIGHQIIGSLPNQTHDLPLAYIINYNKVVAFNMSSYFENFTNMTIRFQNFTNNNTQIIYLEAGDTYNATNFSLSFEKTNNDYWLTVFSKSYDSTIPLNALVCNSAGCINVNWGFEILGKGSVLQTLHLFKNISMPLNSITDFYMKNYIIGYDNMFATVTNLRNNYTTSFVENGAPNYNLVDYNFKILGNESVKGDEHIIITSKNTSTLLKVTITARQIIPFNILKETFYIKIGSGTNGSSTTLNVLPKTNNPFINVFRTITQTFNNSIPDASGLTTTQKIVVVLVFFILLTGLISVLGLKYTSTSATGTLLIIGYVALLIFFYIAGFINIGILLVLGLIITAIIYFLIRRNN